MNNKKVLKNTSLVLLNLAGMALFAVIIVLGVKVWMPYFTHHGEGVEVPGVVGRSKNDACYILSEARLDPVVSTRRDTTQRDGVVLEQTPSMGCRVKSGRSIYLVINDLTPETFELPDDIIGTLSKDGARSLLQNMGVDVVPDDQCEYIEGESDLVLGIKHKGVSKKAGDRIPKDRPIVLVVGRSNDDAANRLRDYDSGTVYQSDGTEDVFSEDDGWAVDEL